MERLKPFRVPMLIGAGALVFALIVYAGLDLAGGNQAEESSGPADDACRPSRPDSRSGSPP